MTEYETPKPGRVFLVRAWWTPSVIPCKIMSLWGTNDALIDVQPLQGNPHARTILRDALRGRIGGHPAETAT